MTRFRYPKKKDLLSKAKYFLEDAFNTVADPIRRELRWIKKCFEFAGKLRNHADFDWACNYVMIAYLIERQRKHSESCPMQHKYFNRDAKNMRTCELLLHRMANDDYYNWKWDKILEKAGFTYDSLIHNPNQPRPLWWSKGVKDCMEYEKMMRKQDMDLFCKIFSRKSFSWWC